jgi:hypothetical protein
MLSRFAVALTCVALYSAVACADDQATLNKIFADWEKRQAAMVRVTYQTEGTEKFFKGSMTDESDPAAKVFPAEDTTHSFGLNLSIDFLRSWARREENPCWHPGKDEFVRNDELRLYDGEHLVSVATYYAAHREEMRQKGKYAIEVFLNGSLGDFFEESELAIFPAHGILPFWGIKPTGLIQYIPKESFKVNGTAEHMKRQVVVLQVAFERPRASGVDEVWVDLARDSAVVQWTRQRDGQLCSKYQIDYEQKGMDWLPSHWTLEKWFGGKPYKSTDLKVTEIKVNPKFEIANFQYEITPGTLYYPDGRRNAVAKGIPGQPDMSREQYIAAEEQKRKSAK